VAGGDTGVLTFGAAVPSLVRWVVSADADLVFRCLATFGPRRAVAIRADLGLAARRVRMALEELADTDLAQISRERAAHGKYAYIWHAVPADAAVATPAATAERHDERPDFPALTLPGRVAQGTTEGADK